MNQTKILMINKYVIIGILSLLNFIPSYSQPRNITVEEAISIAVKQNYDVTSSKLNSQKADQAIREAFGTALPNLNVSAGYTRNLKPPVFFTSDFMNPGSKKLMSLQVGGNNAFNTGVTLSQILFNSAVFTAIGTSKTYSSSAKEQLYSTISKTIQTTKKVFFGALLAKEFWNVTKTTLEQNEENLKSITALFNEGMIAEYDKLRADVGVENIKPMVLQAQSGYLDAVNGLKLTMGMNIQENIEIVGSLETVDTTDSYDENSILSKIITTNYDLKAMDLQRKVLNAVVEVRKAEYYPSLALIGNYTYQGQSNDFNFLTVSTAFVGLNFSMSIFQGFQTDARVQQAKIDYQNLDDRFTQLSEAIKMQIKSALKQLQNAKSRMNVQSKNVETAQRGYDLAQIRYKEGVSTLVELNDALVALTQSKLNKAQTIYDYIASRSDIENLIGLVDSKYLKNLDN